MPLVIRDGTNTPRTITAIQVRDGTNTPRNLTELWARDSGNVPRLIWSLAPPMSATASPSFCFGTTSGTGTAVTDASTVTPTGGTPPYTYAWELVSHDAPAAPTASNPSLATSSFVQTGLGMGDGFSASFRCLVTDSTPGTPFAVYSNPVSTSWVDIS